MRIQSGHHQSPRTTRYHLGAYDVTFHDQGEAPEEWYVTQGQMVVGGNMAVEESSTSSGQKMYYWEIYCLMGDPSLSVYFSVPPALTATYPDVIPDRDLDHGCRHTEPYAYIGLSTDDTNFIAGCLRRCSTATPRFAFSRSVVPGYIDIVITKQNRKPIIDSIQVIPATGPYLTHRHLRGERFHSAATTTTMPISPKSVSST